MKRLFISLLVTLTAAAALIVNRNEAAGVTFTKDVASIIFNKCANCHRPGEVAPMPLTSYAEVRPWSKAIREAVVEREMPPWFADPHTSTLKFSNDRRLSQKEIETIVAWVDAGAPKGDDKDLPPFRKYTPGWTFGEPDMVIEMPVDFEVPAEGELPMQLRAGSFTEERWSKRSNFVRAIRRSSIIRSPPWSAPRRNEDRGRQGRPRRRLVRRTTQQPIGSRDRRPERRRVARESS